MSDLYIKEPSTTGKVIVETNYGNIDIELFTRETPKSCKNFIQHCLNKYYNGCIFFKIFKNFMIQTGDPTNTGNGGESIYSEDFRDEFHSRLKFSHRGVVAMANKNKPNSNGSQFFITLDKCEDMDKKFTIFGKVTGPTFFNAVNISNLSADEDGCPIMNDDEKPKILNTEVVINPFNDLKPTVNIENENVSNKKAENKKNKKLIIKYTSDKMFFKDEENEEGKNKNKDINQRKSLNENEDNKAKKENQENHENSEEKNKTKENEEVKKEDNKENNNNQIGINKDDSEKKIEENENDKEKSLKKEKNEEEDNEESEENNNNNENNEENENSESESKSLSSDDNIVQNAKQLLPDEDEDNIPKNKKKNIDDYKKEINFLRKKIKREKEELYNEDELRKKIEEEKISKMNILQRHNYDYVKSKQSNKLSTDERANKLKDFKSFIGGGDSERWYKTKLKFQTDSQKAFTLDMINKELEKNEN